MRFMDPYVLVTPKKEWLIIVLVAFLNQKVKLQKLPSKKFKSK